MTLSRPTSLPARLTAGDTWFWDFTHPIYSAGDGYTLALQIGGAQVMTWQASYVVVDADTYQITIPPEATKDLPAGVYGVSATFTLAADRYTVALGRLVVLANPTKLAPGDRLANAETLLAVVNDRLAGRLRDDFEYYTIEGRTVGAIPIKELWRIRSELRREVNKLRRKGRPVMKRYYFGNGQ